MTHFLKVGALALTIRCAIGAPFPNGVIPALEQIVCHIAENQTLESAAVQDICGEVGKMYPAGNATCEGDMTKAWGSLATQCQDMDHLADWIQDQFCKVKGNAALEAEVVAVSCGLIHHAVPGVPAFVCTKAMQKTWSLLANECPKTVEGSIELAAPVGDIEKFFCGVMENNTIEHQVSEKICQYEKVVDPKANPTFCVHEIEGLWEAFQGECKDVADLAAWVRDTWCQNAKNPTVEKEFATVTCALAHYVKPQVPTSVCEAAVEEAWSTLESECPAPVAEATIIV